MDVLLLFEYPTVNGGENSILSLLPAIRAAGVEIRAACPPEGELIEALRRHQVEVCPLELHDSGGVRKPLEECRSRLADLLAHRRPDVLHANSLSTARLSGPVARQLKIPSIGQLRDIVRLSRQAILDLNCHPRLLAVSEATRSYHAAQGIDAGRMEVLYNGVDLSEFCPAAPTGYLHQELGLEPDAALLGTIGQIGPRKGLDDLLVAAPGVLKVWTAAHFLIIGERYSQKDEAREYDDCLRSNASRPSLSGHVHFLGRRNDIPQVMRELTLLVHPARQEPLGRVLLEAAASGCPIVATDVGGTREILGPIARLVSSSDAPGLATAVLETGLNVTLRQEMACTARRRVERLFDARRTADALLRQYADFSGL